MPHFPLFVNLRGQRALVVGGGKVALRKVQKLRPYGPGHLPGGAANMR